MFWSETTLNLNSILIRIAAMLPWITLLQFFWASVFSFVKNENKNSISVIELLWGLNEKKLHRVWQNAWHTEKGHQMSAVSLFPIVEGIYPTPQGVLTNY